MSEFHFRFPQISRFFSATLFLTLWASLGVGLAINGLGRLNQAQLSLPYLPVLLQPLSWERHMEAAQSLWDAGSLTQAKHEATLAQDLSVSGTVLGSTISPSPELLASQFDHWKAIAQERPDYRDAFVMAAAYAYQLGNKEEARALINRAFALDPTSPTVQELLKIISR